MAQIACLSSAKLCALRVARLGTDCAPVAGATNGVATSAIVKLTATPEYEIGQEYQAKNGCGDICVYLKDCDRLKRMNLEMELCLRDLELLELLTGAELYSNDATPTPQVIGMARRAIGAACQAPVSVEIWTRALSVTGECQTGTSVPRWWRIVYPKATFTLDAVTFENNVGIISLRGYAEANPSWNNGPWNDWPGATILSDNVAEAYILDEDGPPTTACGYVTVPAQT